MEGKQNLNKIRIKLIHWIKREKYIKRTRFKNQNAQHHLHNQHATQAVNVHTGMVKQMRTNHSHTQAILSIQQGIQHNTMKRCVSFMTWQAHIRFQRTRKHSQKDHGQWIGQISKHVEYRWHKP